MKTYFKGSTISIKKIVVKKDSIDSYFMFNSRLHENLCQNYFDFYNAMISIFHLDNFIYSNNFKYLLAVLPLASRGFIFRYQNTTSCNPISLSIQGFCLKLKISINTKPIRFSILGKLYICPVMVLGNSFKLLDAFKLFFQPLSVLQSP